MTLLGISVLMGLAGLTLLVACLNLANLMLAHAAGRSHEMSMRVVLGASRWSLVRQVLTESLVLSLSGALLGLAFAYWACRLILILITQGNSMLVVMGVEPIGSCLETRASTEAFPVEIWVKTAAPV